MKRFDEACARYLRESLETMLADVIYTDEKDGSALLERFTAVYLGR